ncbi:MAG TPA: hypothetical protein VGB26_10655 [Nitrospiria bacterium]|jgi:hypothetical protein
MEKKKEKEKKEGLPEEAKKKKDQSLKKEDQSLNVIQDPYEFPSIHEEMADLFDEDKVTHKHGGTEPEAD